jgi:uncharacterized protein YkwD
MLKHTLITLAAAVMLIATPSVINLQAKQNTAPVESMVLYDVAEQLNDIEQPKTTQNIEESEQPLEVETLEEKEVEVETQPEEVKEEVKTVEEVKPVTQPKVESAPVQTTPTPTPVQPTPTPAPTPVETQPKEETKAVEVVQPVEEVSSTPAATWELEILRLTNIERQKAGLKLLKYNTTLEEGAKIRSIEIITHFSHTRPDGTRFFTVFGPDFLYRNIGENLASGFRSPEQVVAAWMNSTSHRANILNEKFEELSVAITRGEDGKYRWVQIFYRAR